MDAAVPTSESSARRPRRAAAVDLAGKSTGSEDASDDFEDFTPKAKRKRGVNTRYLGLEDYSLIDIIKSNVKLIPHAVKQLAAKYESDANSVLADILMMLFEACGAKYKINAASVNEMEVDDVVVNLVELAKKGEIEDIHNSKQKELKNFKENIALFWDSLVLECQNGPLFDKFLFEKCMDYIIALSCTPPRTYRQVASAVGLQLVTSFITVAKTLCGQRETTQRQLNAEKKKQADGPRVVSLDKRLSETHENITVIEEMMRKIFTGLFMHRYRDVDPDIRMGCIQSLGIWILSYPSLFLQDLYLKYLGWTLNDKSAAVRKTSLLSLQNLYEVDDNVPLLGLFTERFSNRMIDLADDIDISVSVSAIGLLKLLLRHQLLTDDELGPLYDLLIDEPPTIRHAIGDLVYDHLIAQNIKSSSGAKGGDNESSEVHLGRLLQILREFPDDPILSSYVIDDIWDEMKAIKDWKCIISMLVDENPLIELTDVDATNLVRVLCASARKAVGEKIVPVTDSRKPYHTKAQKEALENSRREITTVMMKNYPQLLQKYVADKAKVSALIDMIVLLKLELFSLKRQEHSFKTILELVTDAFFKHGDKDTLRSCISALSFCLTESQGELQDYAQNKLTDLENELIGKLKLAMKEVAVGDDEYSLLVNSKRLYELQLKKDVSSEGLFEEMVKILEDIRDLDCEVVAFLLLNMYLNVAWGLEMIDGENSSESDLHVKSLLSHRDTLFKLLEYYAQRLSEVPKKGRSERLLSSRVCAILSETWCMFRNSKFALTRLECLGYCPEKSTIKRFWNLCEQLLDISDETEDEEANEEYIEETNRDAILIVAAKLVVSSTVPKNYLGSRIISHFVMHGASVVEIIKKFVADLKKSSTEEISTLFFKATKQAYNRHKDFYEAGDELLSNKSFSECRDLAVRLSATFVGAARNTQQSVIMKIVKDGIEFAFKDSPRRVSFLEGAVLPFVLKLPTSNAIEILEDVKRRSQNVNTDEDPSSWRSYFIFVSQLHEKCAKNETISDEKEDKPVRKRGRPRKAQNVQGKRLIYAQSSSDDDSISASERNEKDDEDDEDQPFIHSNKSSAKLRSLKVH